MGTQQFSAGAANVDITPPLGTFINGDFVAHTAKYIHDRLHSRALVFQNGDTVAAIVVVDICVMRKEFLDEVKADVCKQTGIPFENILISSTHTHAAGSVDAVYLSVADEAYSQALPPLIVQSIALAKQNLRPAKIGWGSVDVPEHVLCRRYKMKPGYVPQNPVTGGADKVKTNPFGGEDFIDRPTAETDPEVGFFAVKGLDNKWISVLANYSLHYVGDWENGTISSDYFGEFSRQLQAKLNAADDFVGIISNGTSGNINIWDFLNPGRYPSKQFEKSKLIGGDIAEKVFNELQQVDWDSAPSLGIQYSAAQLNLRKPTPIELQSAERVVTATNYEQMQITDENLKRLYAREQVLLNDLPDTVEFPIQAIKLGKGVIGGLGAEIFAETGLWLKQNSPVKNYFTICLANGNAGYIPPEHEFENGGYETWRGRTSKLQTDAEAIIRNELLSLINKFTA
ncbi:MAG: neutral/alkaline non-lysosomal ceramidase N-terminal domain-containing protein [Bacteroidota bacterium]